MNNLEVIKAISQESVSLELATGIYTVRPLTVRRMANLAAMLKDVQGDPNKFKEPNSPEFYQAATDMLVAAGENMPKALGLLTGDPELAKLEDVSLLDLSAIVVAAAKVNKPTELMGSFLRAMEVFKGKADQK